MSGRHEAGDATGWKRGAKGITGVGKAPAFGKQRFERDIPSKSKQAATNDKVLKNKGPGRQPGAGRKNFAGNGIDRGKGRGKDWS